MTIQEHISRIKARGFKYKEDKEIAIRSLEAWEKVKAEIEVIEVDYGFDKATKYGNKNAEQRNLSYSTMMMYEVANLVENIKEIIDEHLQEVTTDADSN